MSTVDGPLVNPLLTVAHVIALSTHIYRYIYICIYIYILCIYICTDIRNKRCIKIAVVIHVHADKPA